MTTSELQCIPSNTLVEENRNLFSTIEEEDEEQFSSVLFDSSFQDIDSQKDKIGQDEIELEEIQAKFD